MNEELTVGRVREELHDFSFTDLEIL